MENQSVATSPKSPLRIIALIILIVSAFASAGLVLYDPFLSGYAFYILYYISGITGFLPAYGIWILVAFVVPLILFRALYKRRQYLPVIVTVLIWLAILALPLFFEHALDLEGQTGGQVVDLETFASHISDITDPRYKESLPANAAFTGCTAPHSDIRSCTNILDIFRDGNDAVKANVPCTPSSKSACAYSIASADGGPKPTVTNYEICSYLAVSNSYYNLSKGLVMISSRSNGTVIQGCN
ncbi:MAG: hypothetical protein JO026_00565 [Patescibacteria group bacterium]|nr:hypothetical protein [Patescibacteria group bacterium]